MIRILRKYSTLNQTEQETLENRNWDGRLVLIKIREYWVSRIERKLPPAEANGHNVLRRPGPTRGCRANDDDDDDDDDHHEYGNEEHIWAQERGINRKQETVS
jgi:hypothetical protein